MLLLGIDQGSSSTKGVLLSPDGSVVWQDRVKIQKFYLDPLRVEQDPEEILLSIKDLIGAALSVARERGEKIASMGLAVQSSSVLAWEPSGKVVSRTWSHEDTRAIDVIERLRPIEDEVQTLTGLPLRANFSGPKIALLQAMYPRTDVRVGPLDAFLVERLTNSPELFRCEEGMAARSLLYGVGEWTFIDDLCRACGVDASRLPQIFPSRGTWGEVCGIPLTAVVRDQYAALAAGIAAGVAMVANLGTIGTVMRPMPQWVSELPTGHLQSIAWSRAGERLFVEEWIVRHFARTIHDHPPGEVGFFPEPTSLAGIAYHPMHTAAGTPEEEWVGDDMTIAPGMRREHLLFSLVRGYESFGGQGGAASLLMGGGFSAKYPFPEEVAGLVDAEVYTLERADLTAIGAALLSTEDTKMRLAVRPVAAPEYSRRERYKRWFSFVEGGGVVQ